MWHHCWSPSIMNLEQLNFTWEGRKLVLVLFASVIAALKNFRKITKKHLQWKPFSLALQLDLGLIISVALLKILQNSSKKLFYRALQGDHFCVTCRHDKSDFFFALRTLIIRFSITPSINYWSDLLFYLSWHLEFQDKYLLKCVQCLWLFHCNLWLSARIEIKEVENECPHFISIQRFCNPLNQGLLDIKNKDWNKFIYSLDQINILRTLHISRKPIGILGWIVTGKSVPKMNHFSFLLLTFFLKMTDNYRFEEEWCYCLNETLSQVLFVCNEIQRSRSSCQRCS